MSQNPPFASPSQNSLAESTIEVFYNRETIDSTNDYLSPGDHELQQKNLK